MIVIHSRYATELWPLSESGPAAIITTGTSFMDTARQQYEFANRLFAGELNGKCHCDLRCGILPEKTHKRVAILSTAAPGRGIAKLDGLHLLQVKTGAGATAIDKCVAVMFREKIEAFMIPHPKLIFPSWTLAATAERLLTAVYGGGAVYRESDLDDARFTSILARRSKKKPSKIIDDDREGEEWKANA